MSSKVEKANKIIQTNVLFSMGAGAIPIPILDFAAVTAVQLDMVRQLCSVYDQSYSDVTGKALIGSLTGATFARMGASVVKAIPVVGSILGGVSMAVLSGASTYALGQVCIAFFNGGLDLDNINMDTAKEMFDEQFEKGKKVAQDLKKRKDNGENFENEIEEVFDDEDITVSTPGSAPVSRPKAKVEAKEDNDVYVLLLKLGELRDKGIITEDEFQAKKKDLLDKF